MRRSTIFAVVAFAAAGPALACDMDGSSADASAAVSSKVATVSQQLPAASTVPKTLRPQVAKAPQKAPASPAVEAAEVKAKPTTTAALAVRN